MYRPCSASIRKETIRNIVCSAKLGVAFPLHSIVRQLWNVEYDPRRMKAIRLKMRSPYSTFLLFGNGKLICCGTRTMESARTAIRQLARKIQKLGFNVRLTSIKILNIVASAQLPNPLDLDKFHRLHRSTYELGLFPGLTYRYPERSIVVFKSGKFNVVGCKQIAHVTDLYFRFVLLTELDE